MQCGKSIFSPHGEDRKTCQLHQNTQDLWGAINGFTHACTMQRHEALLAITYTENCTIKTFTYANLNSKSTANHESLRSEKAVPNYPTSEWLPIQSTNLSSGCSVEGSFDSWLPGKRKRTTLKRALNRTNQAIMRYIYIRSKFTWERRTHPAKGSG